MFKRKDYYIFNHLLLSNCAFSNEANIDSNNDHSNHNEAALVLAPVKLLLKHLTDL